MKFRLWPRSLVGQLVFAVAVMLFVAQAINFALLVRGQRQQFLAHGGGMAVARFIDAVGADAARKEAWRKSGSAYFRGDGARARKGVGRNAGGAPASGAGPQSSSGEVGAA